MPLTSWWNDRVLPHLTDHLLGGELVEPWRRDVCSRAEGVTLELGFGSGLSLALYPDAVTQVLAVEPSDEAWTIAQPRIAAYGRAVERIAPDANRIPLSDNSVDTITVQWALCTIPDVGTALAEARRVLRPAGRLEFVEHSLAPDEGVRRQQRRMNRTWQRVGGGCHLTRDAPELLRQAGFEVQVRRAEYAGMPRFATWLVTGTAR